MFEVLRGITTFAWNKQPCCVPTSLRSDQTTNYLPLKTFELATHCLSREFHSNHLETHTSSERVWGQFRKSRTSLFSPFVWLTIEVRMQNCEKWSLISEIMFPPTSTISGTLRNILSIKINQRCRCTSCSCLFISYVNEISTLKVILTVFQISVKHQLIATSISYLTSVIILLRLEEKFHLL